MRALLILLAVLAGFLSFFLYIEADNQADMNRIFATTELGGSFPATGTVERIDGGGWCITGQKLDWAQIDYWFENPFPIFHAQAYVAHDISRAWKAGDQVSIRFWGDGPEISRLDVPSETRRYKTQERITYAASAFALLVCSGCALDQARFKARQR